MRFQVTQNSFTPEETVLFESEDFNEAQRWQLRNRKPDQPLKIFDTAPKQKGPRPDEAENEHWFCVAWRGFCACKKCCAYTKATGAHPDYGRPNPHPVWPPTNRFN